MSLRSSVANGGLDKSISKSSHDGGQEKQKKLLEADAGHFSMIKYTTALSPAPSSTARGPYHGLSSSPLTKTAKQSAPSRRPDHRTQWLDSLTFLPSLPLHRPPKNTRFCGFMSILSSMRYCLGPPQSHGPMWAALAFMPFGLFFDFMDGKVARWRQKSSLMGQELDSLADLV
ncbi:MAG: hypothetical protein L6R35_000501 [Caloplaca aegaea]|nr:MAG: hypothetical protein L6R35_000501 [Caloplaca aegaea]